MGGDTDTVMDGEHEYPLGDVGVIATVAPVKSIERGVAKALEKYDGDYRYIILIGYLLLLVFDPMSPPFQASNRPCTHDVRVS